MLTLTLAVLLAQAQQPEVSQLPKTIATVQGTPVLRWNTKAQTLNQGDLKLDAQLQQMPDEGKTVLPFGTIRFSGRALRRWMPSESQLRALRCNR